MADYEEFGECQAENVNALQRHSYTVPRVQSQVCWVCKRVCVGVGEACQDANVPRDQFES